MPSASPTTIIVLARIERCPESSTTGDARPTIAAALRGG
jgi:hypothetical protein